MRNYPSYRHSFTFSFFNRLENRIHWSTVESKDKRFKKQQKQNRNQTIRIIIKPILRSRSTAVSLRWPPMVHMQIRWPIKLELVNRVPCLFFLLFRVPLHFPTIQQIQVILHQFCTKSVPIKVTVQYSSLIHFFLAFISREKRCWLLSNHVLSALQETIIATYDDDVVCTKHCNYIDLSRIHAFTFPLVFIVILYVWVSRKTKQKHTISDSSSSLFKNNFCIIMKKGFDLTNNGNHLYIKQDIENSRKIRNNKFNNSSLSITVW